MQIALYITGIVLVAISIVSASNIPKWWVKGWDVGRAYIALLLGVALLLTFVFLWPFGSGYTWALVAAMTAALLYHFWVVYPFTPLHAEEVATTTRTDRSIKLLTANVRMSNKVTHKLLALIDEYDPDCITLTEVDQYWTDACRVLDERYPHQQLQPQDNTYGLNFYSKIPLAKSKTNFLVEDDIPSFHLHLDWTPAVQVICLHPRPPAPWTNEVNKDVEVIMAAGMTNYNNLPSIVTGDLNDVGWSHPSKQFKAISGLKDPRIGRGFFNTYNANIPVGRYPVDHFFVSPDFRVHRIERLPHFGSDHFPVFLELNYEPDAST